jgi:putative transposase
VGRAADSRRTAHAWCPRLRAYGVTSAGTAHAPVAAEVEDVPHESPRVSRVDGSLHRSDPTDRVLFVVIVLSHVRRRIVHFNITEHPTAEWTAQQVINAFPDDTARKWLYRDRDSVYGESFRRRLVGMGIAEVISAQASPWQNPYAERVIGSIRRECLDYVIVLNRTHLRRVLTTYSRYYHPSRTHLGLEKDAPDPRLISATSAGSIIAIRKSEAFITATNGRPRKQRTCRRTHAGHQCRQHASHTARFAESTGRSAELTSHSTRSDRMQPRIRAQAGMSRP